MLNLQPIIHSAARRVRLKMGKQDGGFRPGGRKYLGGIRNSIHSSSEQALIIDY